MIMSRIFSSAEPGPQLTWTAMVADISIWNPNVYYELGVRDGLCSRGVFIIQGGWPTPRPFDVAQDRSFRYDGTLFALDSPEHANPCRDPGEDIQKAVDDLAAVFSRALASEMQGIGSPVYSNLP